VSIDCYDSDPCTTDVCTDDLQCDNPALDNCCANDEACATTGGCADMGYCGANGCFVIGSCCGGDEECVSSDPCIESTCGAEGFCSLSALEAAECCPADGVLLNGDIETILPFAINNASQEGGWQLSAANPNSGKYSVQFGNPDTGDLNFPPTSGTLTTDLVAVPAGGNANLTFHYWTSQMGGLKLELLVDGAWIPVWDETSSNLATWNEVPISLNDTAGKVIALRFTYETQFASLIQGLHLDDVVITTSCNEDAEPDVP